MSGDRYIIRTTGQTGPSTNAAGTTITDAGNYFSSSNVEGALQEAAAATAAHLADTSDAHDASAISYAGSTNLSASDVESALDELDSEKAPLASPTFTGTPAAPTATTGTSTTQVASTAFVQQELTVHLNDTSAAHAASAISYAGSTNLSATDVEAALDELDTEKVQIGGTALAPTSATTPVTVKGTTSQTADLFVAKNVSDTTVARIGADGTISSSVGLGLGSGATRAVRHDSSAQLGIGEGYQVVTIRPGAAGVKGMVLFSSSGTGLLASGEGVLYIANATVVPSGTPSGGGILYCEGGALKFKGSSGTVTTIAAA